MAPRAKPHITTNGKTVYLNNKELLTEVSHCKKTGVMSNTLARMLQLLCARYAKKGNFVNYCVDEDTTALTKRGWLSYDEITIKDEILSYDIITNKLIWSKIRSVFVNQSYNDKMHKLDTQGLDALVTPNHKFISKERGIVPVEKIICDEHITLMGLPVEDTSESKYTDHFVELVGWAITEGHYKKDSKIKRCISISQQEGIKADKIRTCLLEGKIPHKEYVYNETNNIVIFNCIGDQICRIYDDIAPNRVPTNEFILSLTHKQRLLLIETMINGDGWFRPNGGMSYVQKDKAHVDAFLFLCTLSGLTTSVVPMQYKTPISKKNPDGGISDVFSINIYVEPKLFCKAEHIDFHGGRPTPGERRDQKQNTPTQHYKGTVWCPQTDYGTFVCRRNKYIYVTGNSYNEDMQAYALMMLVRTWSAFKPERSSNPFAFFTQCIHNSFIQFLNQESNQRKVRDGMLVDSGLNPSFSYLDSDKKTSDDEEDWDNYRPKDIVIDHDTSD
jgi:hypothetical protein